jgi:hypothetical protein
VVRTIAKKAPMGAFFHGRKPKRFFFGGSAAVAGVFDGAGF